MAVRGRAPLALAVVASLAAWAVLLLYALRPEPPAWDLWLSNAIRGISVQGLSGFLKGVTFLGNTKVAVIEELAAAAAILALTRRLAYLVPMLIVAGAELLHQWLKEAIGRPGPDLLVRPDHNSFPSGHVFHAVVFFGLLTALALPLLPARWMRGTLLCLFVGFVAATMFSRVYLGYHWPSDVLASLLDGWPVLLLAVLVLNRLTRRRPTPTPPAA